MTPFPHTELISLWDMLQFYAKRFVELMRSLDSVSTAQSIIRAKASGAGVALPDIDLQIEHAQALIDRVHELRKHCIQHGLKLAVAGIDRLASEYSRPIKMSRFTHHIEDIEQRVLDELKDQLFLQIDSRRNDHFNDPLVAFGVEAVKSFPDAEYDICEAGRSYACDRYTACVHHLMMVLEFGLASLAKKIGVPFAYRQWQSVIDEIEKKIRALGSPGIKKTARVRKLESFASEAATQFRYFKNAWRNHVMHGRVSYQDPDKVQRIYASVSAFMNDLAAHGLKQVKMADRLRP